MGIFYILTQHGLYDEIGVIIKIRNLKTEYKMEKQNEILQLISGSEPLLIPAVDGQRFIQDARDIFHKIDSRFILYGFVGVGASTKEQEVEVYELGKDARPMEMFAYSTNNWNQKFLTQNQVVEFFEQLSSWLPEFRMAKVFFLCKKDETRPINKSNLTDNLAVVGIYDWEGEINVELYQLNDIRVWLKRHGHLVVIPKLKY